jgi:hypothetical protein
VSTYLYPFDLSSTGTYIANSLRTSIISSGMTSSQIECSYFGVTKSVDSATDSNGIVSSRIILAVTFYVDNFLPLTLLDVYTGNLIGY